MTAKKPKKRKKHSRTWQINFTELENVGKLSNIAAVLSAIRGEKENKMEITVGMKMKVKKESDYEMCSGIITDKKNNKFLVQVIDELGDDFFSWLTESQIKSMFDA